MKRGLVTKLEKGKTATSKNIDNDVMSANGDVIAFYPFMAHLQPSRSRIPDAWSIKLTFSSAMTFYLTKTENRTKNS